MKSQLKDGRRTYYDHEKPYRQIAAKGGIGWDDLSPATSNGSYLAVQEFLNSSAFSLGGSGQTVLELGCGGGQVALMFARRGCVVHGVDYSPTAIALAKANAAKAGLAVEFKEGDCLTLNEYADCSMDLVIDNHVWHCLVEREDRLTFLGTAFRVLKTGGVLFTETMTREGAFSPMVMKADPHTFISHSHSRYWVGHEEALNDLKSAGFELLHEYLKREIEIPEAGDLLVVYGKRPLHCHRTVKTQLPKFGLMQKGTDEAGAFTPDAT